MEADREERGVAPPEPSGQERRSLLRKIVLIAGLLCGTGFGALAYHAIQHNRSVAGQMVCSCQLKGIGLALHNYYSGEGCFPPAYIADENGRPMHSWRTLVVPYFVGEEALAEYDFSQPWDSEHNRKVTSAPLPLNHGTELFSCPFAKERSGEAHYLMVVGPKAICDGPSSWTFREMPEGTGEKLYLVEVINSGIHWSEPRDLPIENLQLGVNGQPGRSPSSPHIDGVHVLTANGAVRFLKDDFPVQELIEMAKIE